MALKDDLTQLNNIRDLLEDSQKGYHAAAQRAEDPEIKQLLDHLGTGRTRLIHDVDTLRYQADPTDTDREGGTLKGDLHRAWIAIRDALSRSENTNVLSECERGEDYLLMRYNEVLKKDLAPQTRALVEQQRREVENNVDHISEVRKHREHVEH